MKRYAAWVNLVWNCLGFYEPTFSGSLNVYHFCNLYWLMVIKIIHKWFFFLSYYLFFLVRDDVLIKSIWIKKRKSPLTIPCHAPGVMPLPHCGRAEFSEGEFFVGGLLLGRVVYRAEFSGYRCFGSKRKSEAGTKICPYLAHWCVYNKFS